MVKPLKICRLSGRSGSLILVLAMLGAFLAGCVSDKNVEEASRQRDEYRGHLQAATLSNGRLIEQITAAYQGCDDLSTTLALNGAMEMHAHYTADLGRGSPVVQDDQTPIRPVGNGGKKTPSGPDRSAKKAPRLNGSDSSPFDRVSIDWGG